MLLYSSLDSHMLNLCLNTTPCNEKATEHFLTDYLNVSLNAPHPHQKNSLQPWLNTQTLNASVAK